MGRVRVVQTCQGQPGLTFGACGAQMRRLDPYVLRAQSVLLFFTLHVGSSRNRLSPRFISKATSEKIHGQTIQDDEIALLQTRSWDIRHTQNARDYATNNDVLPCYLVPSCPCLVEFPAPCLVALLRALSLTGLHVAVISFGFSSWSHICSMLFNFSSHDLSCLPRSTLKPKKKSGKINVT